jgi:hypothetical protein
MDRIALLDAIAPCSLTCRTCPARKEGALPACASRLHRYLEGYYDFNYDNLPEPHRAWLAEFSAFEHTLKRFTESGCSGCRNQPLQDAGCVPGCIVPSCVITHGVDFCAECPEFPCEKAERFFATVNDTIGRDWRNGNMRIREIGTEAYYAEKYDAPHYASCKK